MSTKPEVHLPPIRTVAFDPIGGRVGPLQTDFVVEERPLYPPSGAGPHVYWFVEKRGMTTPEMLRCLARWLDCEQRDLGYAGMKDKHAVTRQWISIPERALTQHASLSAAISAEPSRVELPEPLRLLGTSRHTNKLRLGHLSGNRFEIRLVDLLASDPEEARLRATRILNELNRSGLPNYFGRQRFGHAGDNLRKAFDRLVPAALEAHDEVARANADGSRSERGATRQRRRRRSSFEQKLIPSVLQSEVFNRYVTLRIERDTTQLLEGEVVRLAGKSAMFTVTDVATEQSRLAGGDIVSTGPMPGKKMKMADGAALQLETEAVHQLGLSLHEQACQTGRVEVRGWGLEFL